jgi:molybdate transport system regulatory protein
VAGRAELLEAIGELGSIRDAAERLGMSYRHAWGYLRDLKAAAGFHFIERNAGGDLVEPRSRRRRRSSSPDARNFIAGRMPPPSESTLASSGTAGLSVSLNMLY